ncbi:hypothetical protein B0H13DRAFT_1884659 [Mycena leptocephala]|nr:hypothetical protein B0H13DRAFT_1884659 [Mycena leptocephala]
MSARIVVSGFSTAVDEATIKANLWELFEPARKKIPQSTQAVKDVIMYRNKAGAVSGAMMSFKRPDDAPLVYDHRDQKEYSVDSVDWQLLPVDTDFKCTGGLGRR